MIYLQLPPFNPISNGVRSTTVVQRWALTLGRVQLKFSGSITKSTISEIVVKIGARVIFGPISGTELDRLNMYRGVYDQSDRLTIDFTDWNQPNVLEREIGGIDIPALGDEDIYVEVVNSAGAGTPGLSAIGGFTSLQFDPSKPDPNGQLIKKTLAITIPTSGGTNVTWLPDFRGAQIQRVHFAYTGTDWTTSVNGNLQRVECRKNGTAVWDRIECADNRFILREHKKVPQSRFYSLDFIHDNNMRAMLDTRDARALEFNLSLGATDTIKAIVEMLDAPRNF
ncbi:hypothetical protein EYS42_08790 [Aquabacterium lacunae]|uniref:Uncharacterized protein n=1 Tax=Aquabacterium lacunae TaxID=2528630 RepID=A0A4Q9GYN0_9BURK|nr:major capsid protein P2 [Aquabacterium lacunae]TBO31331.1 hypothetical protein EYS42_08790 [Aquabacterium lacunae]